MSATEASFDRLATVPVHYDRLPNFPYGSKGDPRSFQCRDRLKSTLNDCLSELFDVWGRGRPTIILTAGTIGDGENAHGQGFAFDLDGFYWGEQRFMMDEYPEDRRFYVGINAHLFLYFSQVLSFHYPNHRDHFHVDFNFSFAFRTASNAQTFFLQSALKYIFNRDIGATGTEDDGVDGVYGSATKPSANAVLAELGLAGQGGLTVPAVWKEFLLRTRARAFQ
ncbi:hypothetical protein [Rhizobium sp. WYJ-E13]|uniref:hypothetical protein n=1 Tax=Rhizobium sp. WYJ-E13 TaxID=2849093 RepID=UPI001C1F0298|nr:hypothetical protein [Rhizobium sp. WYJ-E13]QWW71377.1 hypothetical protein KQ933_22235 [Rhizobium sp. WYJ-E13]